MILNALAMEFLMDLDNEFEAMYLSYLPEVGEDIYDNVFITPAQNKEKLIKRKKNCWFNCTRDTLLCSIQTISSELTSISRILYIYGDLWTFV